MMIRSGVICAVVAGCVGVASAQTARPPAPYPQLLPGQTLPNVPPPPGAITAEPLPPAVQAPTVAPAPVAPVVVEWLAQGGAELRALDKLTARVSSLSLRTGETVKQGSLSITLRGCLVRPADRAADAAAFLEIVDNSGGPGFRGWMLVSAPSLAVLESPTWDVRPVGCRP